MSQSTRGLVGVMLVLALTAMPGPGAYGQAPTSPAQPAPFLSPDQSAPALGRPVPLAPDQVPTPLAYTPPPLLVPTTDPGPNGWAPYEPPSSPAGYFVDAEIAVLFLDLKDKISNDFGVTPSGNILHVPTVSLGTTVSPKIEFGYRLPDSAGYFAVSYRFVVAEGDGTQTFDSSPFDTRTRLDLQIFDLDYGTAMYEVAPNYKIGWRIGARLENIFFDSRIRNAVLEQQASNSYLGSGPHFRLDGERKFDIVQGLSLFGRLDGAVLIGQIKQRFQEDEVQSNGSTLESDALYRHSQSVPTLLVQAGLSYVPPILPYVTITTGYQFEGYWYLGQFNTNGTPGTSRAQLYSNGWFLRAQVDF
jgi:hypothetical protein